MEEQQPRRRGRPSKAAQSAGGAPTVHGVSSADHNDGPTGQGDADETGPGETSDWPALIARALDIHTQDNQVCQIYGRNPPREWVQIHNVGATLIEGEPGIITADGTRH